LTAQKNLEEAVKKKQDAELISPISWKIVNIEWKIWETTNSLKNPFVTIINTKSLFVESYVEESDIVKVKQNQDVYINFDSIEWLTMTWKVIYINEKANIDANSLVTYEVLIAFESSDSRVKDGMSTVIEFITKEIQNVLIIPVQSVKTVNKKPSVKLDSWEWKNIITWFTDWKMVEVVSWLSLWDKILY
jgi:multidrug efflux pump subunit AcrA (membrane-fusion protein)